MNFRRPQISTPGLIVTLSLHAVVGMSLLMSQSVPDAPAHASVMVSLINSEDEQRIHVPAKTRPTREKPPVAQAPGPGPKAQENTPSRRAHSSAITPPRHDADYLSNPPPVYPAFARRLGEQGEVMLRVLVREDGTPVEVTIERSSGSVRLDQAAVTAVRQWRFIAAHRGGTPVAAPVLVPISFSLRG